MDLSKVSAQSFYLLCIELYGKDEEEMADISMILKLSAKKISTISTKIVIIKEYARRKG